MPNRSRRGGRQQPRPRCRADQRERAEVDAHRARGGAFADDQVELEILHRRVQHLLDGGLQAVDLVDEQHVPGLQVGQDGREVAGALDHRPRRRPEPDAQLARHDLRQRGLAQARRAVQQHMVHRLAAALGRLDEGAEVFAAGLLADELGQRLRPQTGFGGVFLDAERRYRAVFVAIPGITISCIAAHLASSFRLSRMTASSGASSPSRSITLATAGCASWRR